MGDVAREQGAAVADLDGPPETAHPWPDALAVAEQVLADMRGGDLFDVSPDRSARIIAKVIDDARRAGFVRARDIAAEHASFVDDDEGDGSIESIIRAMDPSEANLPSIPQEVTAGIMTVDLGVSETEGRVAKIEAPLGCAFTRADGTPYKVGDAIKVGDPVSYSDPRGPHATAGGKIVMTGVRL